MPHIFVLFGVSGKKYSAGAYGATCKKCGLPWSHTGVVEKIAFTLFFVPIIPLGYTKRLVCNRCGHESTLRGTDFDDNPSAAVAEGEKVLATRFAAAHPPCPKCRMPLDLIPQYNKWYCPGCKEYP